MTTASDAYDRLHKAMETTTAACTGLDLFTSDELCALDWPVLKAICNDCELLTLCRAYTALDSRNLVGYWAGRQYGRTMTRKQPEAA